MLSRLAKSIIQRDLPKIKLSDQPFSDMDIDKQQQILLSKAYDKETLKAFVFSGSVSNQAYQTDDTPILLLRKSQKLTPIHE
ncbi:MAG: hypothetical protein ACO39T_05375 [Flavobacteriaceae bacterium]